jgi:hypothetical protein
MERVWLDIEFRPLYFSFRPICGSPQTLAELKKIDCARMMEIVLGRLDDIMFRRARAQHAVQLLVSEQASLSTR